MLNGLENGNNELEINECRYTIGHTLLELQSIRCTHFYQSLVDFNFLVLAEFY
jgi:hypothetical protein